jgi:hypothetical protein
MKKRADTATKTRRKRDATMKKVARVFLTMRHRIRRHEKQKRISPPPLSSQRPTRRDERDVAAERAPTRRELG